MNTTLSVSRSMKLCALAESGGCGLENGLRKAYVINYKKKLTVETENNPTPRRIPCLLGGNGFSIRV